MMSKAQHEELTKKLWNNELYCKSRSAHKVYQFMQFTDAENNPLEGQQVRREDEKLRPMGSPGFDESTARIVIYNFKDGYHHICYEVEESDTFTEEFKALKIGKIFTPKIKAPAINNRFVLFACLTNGMFVEFLLS